MVAAPREPTGRSHAHRVRSTCGVAALLAPPDRNKTLTALAEAEQATAPHDGGALPPDDSGDRKSGHATAYASRQYLGSCGHAGNGIVAATTARPDEPVYFPPHTVPYRPAPILPPADMAEIVSLYGLRGRTEQDHKHVKHELGWADVQVRSAQATQRHWTLIDVAFAVSWHQPPNNEPQVVSDPPSSDHNRPADTRSWPARLRRVRRDLTLLSPWWWV